MEKEQDSLNKQIAEDLYKQINWLSIMNKTFIIGYLLEKVIGEKVFDHSGFKRLWAKYENNKRNMIDRKGKI